MTRPFIDSEWSGTDGRSECVMRIDLDGRLHINVHDIDDPGYTASFSGDRRPEIAAFIKGDITE